MRRPWRTFTAAAAAAALWGPAPSHAGEPIYGLGIDTVMLKPALDPNGFFNTERAAGLKQYEFGLRVGVGFAQEPLKLDTLEEDGQVEAVLNSQLAFDFGISFGLSDKLTFGFSVPIVLQPLGSGYGKDGLYRPGDPEAEGYETGTGFFSTREEQNTPPSENGPGDLRLGLKYRITDMFGVQLVAYVPFGDEDVFTGSGGFTFEPKLIVDLNVGKKAHVTINAGARVRDGVLAETREVNAMGALTAGSMFLPKLYVGTEGIVGVAALYEVSPKLSFGGEITMLVPILKADDVDCPDPCKNGDLTGEALLGAMFGLGNDKKLTVGAGTSIIPDAARSAGFRAVASLSWSPSVEGSRVGARGDTDGDGIPNGPDVCPDEPEDDDSFQDDDGCPELDNDLDSVLDAQDKCPSEPEDRDGFDDEDGCPEGDNDNDKVPDLNDRCPGEAEDLDGFDDDDGCPDEDNDGDGILDAKDQCVDQPETVNGYLDLDGCPDQAVQGGPRLGATKIDMQGDRIEFTGKTAKLTKASEGVLDQVADVMKKNPQARFRIEVGVEETGKKPANKKADVNLTEDRADVVLDYLRKKGVNNPLDVAGLGSDRPIDRDPKGQKNRRVEFILLTQ